MRASRAGRARAYSAKDAGLRGRPAGPQHRVPWPQPGDTCADLLDHPRHVGSEPRLLRLADSETGKPHEVGHSGHDVPRTAIQACRPNSEEHLALTGPGTSTFFSSSTSAEPYRSRTTAFIVRLGAAAVIDASLMFELRRPYTRGAAL